jgi:hypothetical protein
MLTQRQIRANFELIEQEKAVLEEEFGNALTLSEDLQVQYEQIQSVKCSHCASSSYYNSSGLFGISE